MAHFLTHNVADQQVAIEKPELKWLDLVNLRVFKEIREKVIEKKEITLYTMYGLIMYEGGQKCPHTLNFNRMNTKPFD